MSKQEAEKDGVEFYYDENVGSRGHRGALVYLVPCKMCGQKIKRLSYGRNANYLCDDCKSKKSQRTKAMENELYRELTTQGDRRFNAAVTSFRKQTKDIQKYAKAIALAKTARDKYGSVPEAMVAIELLYLGYRVIPQQKIRKYRVDFYLPEEHIVVEVDGEIFHHKQKINRDAVIQFALGPDTKIIHIPAELIEKDIHKLKRCLQIP